MTKKEKRKKETLQTKEETEEKKDSSECGTDKDDRGTSNSRSRSRGRRSLSSLFKKSRGRAESGDTSNVKPNDEAGFATVSSTNPRTDPRGHLQRMTVREALARNRGRSPNRRTKKLERQILNNEPGLSGDSLSISLPHLPDHFSKDQSETPTLQPGSFESQGGSTMPRVKKRQGYSEGSRAQGFRQSNPQDLNISSVQDKAIQILPLDKRKYLINKEVKNNKSEYVDSFINSDIHNETNRTHSSRSELKITDELSENERRRRESYNQFISLREKKPMHAHFQVPSEYMCDNVYDVKSVLPNEQQTTGHATDSLSAAELQAPKSDTNENSFITSQTKEYEEDAKDEHERMKEEAFSNIGPIGDSTIPVNENGTNKTDKVKRSAYVSPRRFSRSSRTSVTSNKSLDTSKNNHSLPALERSSNEQSGESEKFPVKYRRYFSRESKHKPSLGNEKDANEHQKMVDASTSIDDITASISTEEKNHRDSSFHLKPNVSDRSLQDIETNEYIANKEIEDGEEIILKSKDEIIENDTCIDSETFPVAGAFLREVKVIDSANSGKIIQSDENDSVFRPIQPDNDYGESNECKQKEAQNINKPQNVGSETDEIEVISSELLTENENKTHNEELKEDIKVNEEQKKCTDSQNNAENIPQKDNHENTEKTSKKLMPGKSKKEKRKTKNKKDKNKKDSNISNKSADKEPQKLQDTSVSKEKESSEHLAKTVKDNDNHPTESCKGKKRKSILKRRSKEKQNKPKVGKPLARTASLSKVIEKRETIMSDEQRKGSPLKNKRSRSMDDISKEPETAKEIVVRKSLKDEKLKAVKRESQTVITKEVRPQPKLSIAAIVAIRAKISRMKKAKQLQEEMKAENKTDEPDLKSKESIPKGDTIQETDDNTDMSVAKVFYENEINRSIGKADSISIIEDTDQEVKDLVYDKRIQFASFCDDTISEEEMIKQRQRNTRLTSRRESKVRQRQKKVINCCKKGIAFLFSHIGLCSLVVGYCILGGIIFKALEGDNEIEQKKEIRELRQNFTEKIYRLAFETTLTKGSREVFIKEVNEILKNFSVMIHKQTKEAGWDGKEIKMVTNEFEEPMEPEPEQWSYPSSLLYAITVMTTIGKTVLFCRSTVNNIKYYVPYIHVYINIY